MRILHVLTYVGPGNPFGGPASVARGQADELRRRGHEVVVAAAQSRPRRSSWRASSVGVRGFDSYRVLPGAGFSGIVAPDLLRFAARDMRSFDVVHVHLARDLVTLPIALMALRAKVPYVLQPHGMVDGSSRPLAKLLDVSATRRVFAGAAAVFSLTAVEDRDLESAVSCDPGRIVRLRNGVDIGAGETPARAGRRPEVLFCSRLHERKRPVLFAEVARDLVREGSQAHFALVGPDEGEAGRVASAIAVLPEGRVRWEGALEPDAVRSRLARADVLVLPSVNEPYPMVVLEALAESRPVVVTASCGLASFVETHRCGIVVPDDDAQALAEAINRLVDDPVLRERFGAAGRRAIAQEASISSVVDELLRHYEAIGR